LLETTQTMQRSPSPPSAASRHGPTADEDALAQTPVRPLTLSQKKRRRTATPRWNVDDSLVGDENTHPNLFSAGRGDIAIKGSRRRGLEGREREANILTPLRLR
jgi:hypothetical protein